MRKVLLFTCRKAKSTNQVSGYRSLDENNNRVNSNFRLDNVIRKFALFTLREQIQPIRLQYIGHVINFDQS